MNAWPRNRLVVLGWHNVEPSWRYPTSGVAGFVRQLRALRRFCTVVPLEPSLVALREGRELPPRAVAITFDDGYRDNLSHAVPALRALGLPATIFLVPEFLSGRVHAWWERLAWAIESARVETLQLGGRPVALGPAGGRRALLEEIESDLKTLDEAGRLERVEALVAELDPAGDERSEDLFLDWDGARELVRAGITIGSHTMSHAILANEEPATVRADLAASRTVLRNELGVGIDTLAYPNGQPADYDAGTVSAAADAGYRNSVTAWRLVSDPGTPPHEIRRRLISTDLAPARLLLGTTREVARAR